MWCDDEIQEGFIKDGYYDCPICCERINDDIELEKSVKCCKKNYYYCKQWYECLQKMWYS